MSEQLPLLLPGTKVRHRSAGMVAVVAESQEPIRGIEWIHSPETVYVWSVGQRIPMFRQTLIAHD